MLRPNNNKILCIVSSPEKLQSSSPCNQLFDSPFVPVTILLCYYLFISVFTLLALAASDTQSQGGWNREGLPPPLPHILKYQLTLSQPGGIDYAHHKSPQDFQTLLRPCRVTTFFFPFLFHLVHNMLICALSLVEFSLLFSDRGAGIDQTGQTAV